MRLSLLQAASQIYLKQGSPRSEPEGREVPIVPLFAVENTPNFQVHNDGLTAVNSVL